MTESETAIGGAQKPTSSGKPMSPLLKFLIQAAIVAAIGWFALQAVIKQMALDNAYKMCIESGDSPGRCKCINDGIAKMKGESRAERDREITAISRACYRY